MAVKLRLRREGTKKKTHFRVVAADSRAPRDGRFIEILGEYHPMDEPSTILIDEERALHWLRNGAQPTETVRHLLQLTGIWEQFKPGDEPERQRTADAIERARTSDSVRTYQEAAAAAEAAEAEEAAAPEKVEEEVDETAEAAQEAPEQETQVAAEAAATEEATGSDESPEGDDSGESTDESDESDEEDDA